MVLSLGQAVEGFRGVEVVEGYLVAGAGSVVGGNKQSGCMGTMMEPMGIGHPIPISPYPKKGGH